MCHLVIINLLKLRWIETHFPPILIRKTTLYKFTFVFLHTNPHLKKTTTKNVYSERSKFFPFKLDPCSKGRINNFYIVVSLESVSIRHHLYTLWTKSADEKLIFFLSLAENRFVKACFLGKKIKMPSAEKASLFTYVHSLDHLGFSTCRTFPVGRPVTSYPNALFMVPFSVSLNFTTNHIIKAFAHATNTPKFHSHVLNFNTKLYILS